MNQAVIFKDYDSRTELEVAAVLDHVHILARNGKDEVLLILRTGSAREVARVLNLIATFAEAEGGSDAKE